MYNTASSSSQWLFPPSALLATPSACPLEKELYDRARGVEFLFRLGTSLGLSATLVASEPLILFIRTSFLHRPSSAMFTAATWFHRFYMRYAMEDYHRQVRTLPLSRNIVLYPITHCRTLPRLAYFSQLKRKNVEGSFAMWLEFAGLKFPTKMCNTSPLIARCARPLYVMFHITRRSSRK